MHNTNESEKPQIEDASSINAASFSHFKHFDTEHIMLNNNLYSNNETIEGRVISITIMIAIIPQEFFINDILDVTVLNASLTVDPTIGIKLLIANFAVFMEILSADCDNTLLHDKTNIKIDMTKTVIPVNVFFKVLEKPLKSKLPPIDLIIEKHKQIFMIGNIKVIRNFSTKEINKIREVLAIVPLVTFPVKKYNDAIRGAKDSITLHNPFK